MFKTFYRTEKNCSTIYRGISRPWRYWYRQVGIDGKYRGSWVSHNTNSIDFSIGLTQRIALPRMRVMILYWDQGCQTCVFFPRDWACFCNELRINFTTCGLLVFLAYFVTAANFLGLYVRSTFNLLQMPVENAFMLTCHCLRCLCYLCRVVE